MPLEYKLMMNSSEVQTNKRTNKQTSTSTTHSTGNYNFMHVHVMEQISYRHEDSVRNTRYIYIWIDKSDILFYCILFKSLAPSHYYILTHHTSITIKDNHH